MALKGTGTPDTDRPSPKSEILGDCKSQSPTSRYEEEANQRYNFGQRKKDVKKGQ